MALTLHNNLYNKFTISNSVENKLIQTCSMDI